MLQDQVLFQLCLLVDKITPLNATGLCLAFPLQALIMCLLTIPSVPSGYCTSMETNPPMCLVLLQQWALFVLVERVMPLTCYHPSAYIHHHQMMLWVCSTSQLLGTHYFMGSETRR